MRSAPYYCNRCRLTHVVHPCCVCCQRFLHETEHGNLMCNDCRETEQAKEDSAYEHAFAHQMDGDNEENPF